MMSSSCRWRKRSKMAFQGGIAFQIGPMPPAWQNCSQSRYRTLLIYLTLQPPVTHKSIVKKIEDGYAKLQAADNCTSLLKRHLTQAVMDQLKETKTKSGFMLWDVIQSGVFSVLHRFYFVIAGVVNVDSRVGVYAADAESYTTFKALFDPILEVCHFSSMSSFL